MKNKIYLLLIAVTLISCSKESNENSIPENQENIENLKLLKSVIYTDFWFQRQEKLEFSYSDGLLVKENNGGELVYYEYNSDGKIISEKECSDQNLSNINIDTYNCSGFYPPYNSTLYTYTNGLRDGLNYDSNGNLISDISPEGSDSLYYTYDDNGNVLSMYVTDGGGGYTITYEYDGQKNPFNVLWKKYGYYDWGGQRFEPYQMVGCIFKQNATKVYKDNVLEMEANYTYDSDGYPISCGFIEYLSDRTTRQGEVSFIYLE